MVGLAFREKGTVAATVLRVHSGLRVSYLRPSAIEVSEVWRHLTKLGA